MAGLPATIVTALAAIQPMTVVFLRCGQKMIGKMVRDHNFIEN